MQHGISVRHSMTPVPAALDRESRARREFFAQVGQADIIVGYTRSMWQSRAWLIESTGFGFQTEVLPVSAT